MLRIEGIKLPVGCGEAVLREKVLQRLRLRNAGDLLSLTLLRRSIDAREGVQWVCAAAAEVKGEAAVLRRCRDRQVSRWTMPEPYAPPAPMPPAALRPIVVGAGPAGLFAALVLARAGQRPILLERGRPVEQRQRDVEEFFRTGHLDPRSNVQFGEGGAGAFSDGKLNTGTRDIRHRFILEELAACGAPRDILVDAKPHVGTDYLHIALRNLRRELIALGADVRFEHQLTDLLVEDGALSAVTVTSPRGTEVLPCRHLILAPGHSARDTFAMLLDRRVPMEPKAFAVGVRIEQRQHDIDAAQYKEYAGAPGLPASTYKLSCHLPSGRAAFSFCVCPGGEVVAAASEEGGVVTNGMSEFARDKENINGALLVNVTPEDFGGDGPLAGVEFQRRLEEAAFDAGGRDYRAPAQRVEDFLAGKASEGPGRVAPSYRPGVRWCDLHDCLPSFVSETISQALPILGRKLPGYAAPDAVMTAVESRSSSPVRIPRGEDGQSPVRGLYPCGEGAGYAGGILSAAADGCRMAELVCAAIAQEI